MSTAIKVENLSKAYQLGTIGTGTLSRDLERWIARVRGKEDPFLTIGEANDRSVKGTSDVVLSLNNISFDIEQGDAVGIIGRNGAGKSTLLKLLSRVTSPTTGSIKVKGRIASLLEVGTGFHPELTGRENIFLNGAILGMRKKEIARKFDQIVDFAGVERYIDTPVKRYSSGMYVRLAFAVAAHLESEILIVDEVLAVGDADFQKKCLGKMGDVSKGEGRTVLFVSHNMGSVLQLCQKGVLLKNGKIETIGNINKVVEEYSFVNNADISYKIIESKKLSTRAMYFTEVHLVDETGRPKSEFAFNENVNIITTFAVNTPIKSSKISITIQNRNGDYLTTIIEDLNKFTFDRKGEFTLNFKLEKKVMAANNYLVRVALFIMNGEVFDLIEMICPFKVFDSGTNMVQLEGYNYGNYFINYDVSTI